MWNQPIICSPETKIYIFSPAGTATGGPEALHQLGHHLNQLGFNAFMFYYDTPDSRTLVHDNYKRYNVSYVTRPENKAGNIMILPETYLAPLFRRKYSAIKKVVWWLSVVNYYLTQKEVDKESSRSKRSLLKKLFSSPVPTFQLLKDKGVLSIAHSWYSVVHLRKNGVEPVGQLSDYMNDVFLKDKDGAQAQKEAIIIWNPKKNDDFLQEIIDQTSQFQWKAISNMSPEEVAGWMNRAKLYLDFGYHPGKERMPREACIMRCCMIIGKVGSAAYAEDMPIPEKYRFEKNHDDLPAIIKCINDCMVNYDKCIGDFNPYRDALYGEKEKFIADIKKLFVKV
ncbi:MAG TPA: hypothetical protein VG367_11935 [Mucilaginibacter sp.]|jgi:hypothetical protein|nr:hypothetical protein [Mucilaginibacter sp.]